MSLNKLAAGVTVRAEFPHCDSNILHEPGKCRYCDCYADRQAKRVADGVNFTGCNFPGFAPCPSEVVRSLEVIEQWHGNRAASPRFNAPVDRMRLYDFVKESNLIEGIRREPLDREVSAHVDFLRMTSPSIEDVSRFVSMVQPGALLRSRNGMNVRVGNHLPPGGGPHIVSKLLVLLHRAIVMDPADTPYRIHQAYEALHPYIDGNGRSGRALWLWSMQAAGRIEWALDLRFLHAWYYQSLEASA